MKEHIKLMLVDDEKRYLDTAAKLIRKKGYDVVTARNGQDALAALEATPVHVVVLDIKMPGMDGIEILSAIRSLYPQVAVILLTGHATADAAADGLSAGACAILTKPIDVDTIIEKALEIYERRPS